MTGFAAPLGGMILRSQPGAIPWLTMAEWCDRHDYGAEEAEWLISLVTAMDAEYLEWWRRKGSQQ
jgi:hypothetical protein